MHTIGIQDILSNVEKPSRYLGTEINRVIKDPNKVALRMVLAFPDLYDIGTSHFGIQILYHLLNQRTDCYAERVFCPAADYEAQLREHRLALCSLETQTPLKQFDIIGFSLLYELNFTNVLHMLNMSGLALRSKDRSTKDPVIIAGGPCVSNPEPMAPFFDAMVFGDGETVLPRMAEQYMAWKRKGGHHKTKLLQSWAESGHVYVPSFFEAKFDDHGFQRLTPVRKDMTDRIKRAVVDDLDTAAFPLKPVVPYGKPVHDRLRLEISRGCSRGCRFCQAGMIYRPVRERSPSNVLRLVKEGLAHTGYEDISLLSLSTGDYTCLTPLMMQLMVLCWKQRVAVSLPSIRAGALTPELMQLIRQVRKTGFTIAPEAGSQRLRDVINKNLTEEEIVNTVENAFSLGWKVIKLYFMIGLPTEAQEDLDAIVALVSRLKQIKGTGRKRGRLNVSITPFIPKAHTPFQWEAQIGTTETRKKIEYLKAKLNTPGVHFKWQNPDMSLLEGMISRGDRRVADIIENAWRLGCIFDGWSDRFDANRWQHAINESGISAEHFTKRARELDEPLPWDHMDSGINRLFLRQQHVAARKGEPISDCRYGDCHQCGICDFKTTSPKIFKHYSQPENGKREESQEGEHKQLALSYTKIDQARFFGHLEVAGMFARALRRSGVEVVYSRGFHPMPRISFENPIPLGMESLGERMRIKVGKNVTCRDLLEGLQRHMPEGIRITSCRPVSGQDAKLSQGIHRYRIFINSDKLDWSIWRRFQSMAAYPYQRTGKRGVGRSLDLKEFVQKATYNPKGWLQIHIASQSGVTLRPAEVLKVLFNVTAKEAATLKTVKLASADYHQES